MKRTIRRRTEIIRETHEIRTIHGDGQVVEAGPSECSTPNPPLPIQGLEETAQNLDSPHAIYEGEENK